MSILHSISQPKDAKLGVVFIHGLADDPFACGQHDKENLKDSGADLASPNGQRNGALADALQN